MELGRSGSVNDTPLWFYRNIVYIGQDGWIHCWLCNINCDCQIEHSIWKPFCFTMSSCLNLVVVKLFFRRVGGYGWFFNMHCLIVKNIIYSYRDFKHLKKWSLWGSIFLITVWPTSTVSWTSSGIIPMDSMTRCS